MVPQKTRWTLTLTLTLSRSNVHTTILTCRRELVEEITAYNQMSPDDRYRAARMKRFKPGEVAVVWFDMTQCFTYRPTDETLIPGNFPRPPPTFETTPWMQQKLPLQLIPGVFDMLDRLARKGYGIGGLYKEQDESYQLIESEKALAAIFRWKVEVKPSMSDEGEAFQKEEALMQVLRMAKDELRELGAPEVLSTIKQFRTFDVISAGVFCSFK